MANRKNTFLIKRSNIAGKVPAAGDLLLGELAINTADAILYASGTTANSIIPIGWDRVARTGDTMTGGLFTPYLSATTISATSINTVDYIVFNTGTTSAATQAGTVYFDNTEKALSYNTSINQGVTVNLGQQNYIRVFNNSGSDIIRGKALELLSSYSGLPSVSLAINRKNGSNIIGVSSEIIPNGKEGVAITYGIISNIELTGMTVGSLIYASDNIPGNLVDANKYLTFPLTARTNQIGYVVETGATTGKLFIDLNNENTVLSLTDLERNVLEGNVLSTGVFQFSGITLSTGNTFNVGLAQGWIIDNTTNYLTPLATYVYYSGETGLTTPYLTSHTETFIYLTSGSTLSLSPNFPTPEARRLGIYLGKLGHANKTSIVNVFNEPDNEISPLSQFRDMFTPIKLINDGIVISPNGVNLQINNSAGIVYGMGINFTSNVLNPNSLSIVGNSPVTFQYRTQTGGSSSNTTSIIPSNYDNNGVITPIGLPLKQATNQRIYLLQNGQFRIQYGQTVYTDLTTAIASAQSEVFNVFTNFKSVGILVGILSLRSDTTNLSDSAYSKITFVSKFGELLGGTGGISTTTLQQAYDNSSNPEIVINSLLDGLSIKNGTGNADNITRLIEGMDATGNITSFIRADGNISGTTLQTSGFTANSNGITANTLNIISIGSGTPITNLGVDSSGKVVSGTTGGSTFTGGTVSGATIFTNGLTANTISATTYFGLPIDVRTTGVTVSSGSVAFNRNDSMSAYTVSFSGVNINVISDDTNKIITFSASTGGSALPTLNQAQIFIGDTLNVAQARSVTGDIGLNFSGLTTIQPNVVTYSKMQQMSTNAILGSQSVSGGTVEEIPMIDAYITSGSAYSAITNTNNWDIDGFYTGTSVSNTYQGQSCYDSRYWYTAVDDNNWIRLIRG